MAGFPDVQEAAILDHYFGGTALAAPTATHKIDLLTTQPSDDAGTGLVKASWTGYVQGSFTNNATTWPAATGADPSLKSNGIAMGFAQRSQVGSDTVTGFVIYKLDGTTIVFVGTVTPNAAVSQNDTPEFAIGDLDLKLGDPGDSY